MSKAKAKAYILLLVIGLTACGIKKIDLTEGWSANKLFTEARGNLKSGNYESALEYYEKLRGRFPHSKQARQAEIDMIYAYFKFEEPETALAAAARFISENPEHPHLDYVYYLRGIIHTEIKQDLISKFIPHDPAARDPKSLRESFKYFAELVSRFPASRYSRDAYQRMIYTRNKMGEHELNVARFYFKRKSYVAAINRAKTVVEKFQKTPSAAKALYILRDSYAALGQKLIAADYDRIIRHNRL